MLAILFHSIHHPDILTRATLFKKQIIIKLLLLLSLVVAMPGIVSNYNTVQTIHHNLQIVSDNLPTFRSNGQSITKIDGIDTKSEAIQTPRVYYLYDVSQSVSASELQKHITSNDVTIVTREKETTYYIFGRQLLHQHISTEPISTQSVRASLQIIQISFNISYLLIPIATVFTYIGVVIIQNAILTLASHLAFLIGQKRVRFSHLWRVSLFASFGPYVILSIVNLFGLSVPFDLLLVTIYTIYVQQAVLKSALHPN